MFFRALALNVASRLLVKAVESDELKQQAKQIVEKAKSKTPKAKRKKIDDLEHDFDVLWEQNKYLSSQLKKMEEDQTVHYNTLEEMILDQADELRNEFADIPEEDDEELESDSDDTAQSGKTAVDNSKDTKRAVASWTGSVQSDKRRAPKESWAPWQRGRSG